ncbi:putative bcl-2-related ovarian killer protein-like B-like [Apostichopus japonicus]|uniref:Putative bcl-2-related ovarian killer protein-like B-like n=2 Tax=Stichopus japonicus TaxID=307972 RepID=A0A2G8JYW3_STIJA|nr:putative bcl-2-related ovarian killer protein-like B-like [Apostichopus japonicus]
MEYSAGSWTCQKRGPGLRKVSVDDTENTTEEAVKRTETLMTGKMRHPREEPAFLKVQRKLECEKHSLSRRAYLRKVIHQLRRAIVNNFFERVKLLEWKVYKGLRLPHVKGEDELVEMSYNLFRDFVQYRLPNSLKPNINPKFRKKVKSNTNAIFLELQLISNELDRQYPNLYRDIASQLNVTISSKRIVEEVFHDIAREIFKDEITWVRIISLYMVTSSLVIECLLQGNGVYMQFIFNYFKEFVRTDLATWMLQHGGWGDLVRTFHGHWLTDYPVLLMAVTSLFFILLYMVVLLFESAVLSSRRHLEQ